MVIKLALFWSGYQINYHPLIDIELWCLLPWARNENLRFYLSWAVLWLPLSQKSIVVCTLSRMVWRGCWAGPAGRCSLDNPARPLHFRITSMNKNLEETLQFSDRGKQIAPRLHELSINSQESFFLFNKEILIHKTIHYLNKQACQSSRRWLNHRQHKLASVGIFADWGFRSCLRWYFGDPFEHHMCVPNAAITLWPQMLFSFTSWVL